MSTGRQTLASIEASIEDLQRQERALQAELEAGNKQRAGLVETRLGTIRELAEVRTRTAVSDGVIDDSDRLIASVRSLLEAREKTRTQLNQRHAEIDTRRNAALKAHDTTANAIEAMEHELDAAAGKARDSIADSPGYASAAQALKDAQSVHAKARDKADRAVTDRNEKGRAFEQDPLFMYLWRRQCGSSSYHPMRAIKWLDGLVANMVGYPTARANYAVLLEIPVRLNEHAARLADAVTAATKTTDALLAARIKEIAGRDLTQELEAARANYTTENKALDNLSDELTEVSSQLNRYAEGLDHAFRKAVNLTADFLAAENLAQLRSLARETQTPTDDQLVERLARLDGEIETLTDRSDVNRHELERLFAKKTELTQAASNFRRAHYDDPGSIFVPEGVGGVILRELLRGAIDGAEYWARTRSSHRWRSRPGDPYRRESDSWPLGGADIDWPTGEGSSRDHGSDDDFSTGGGF